MNKILVTILITAATACNVTKRLPAGEKLYTGADVNVKGDHLKKKEKKEIREDLKKYITPRPNKSILGIRYKLWVYQVTGTPKKEKGIKHWLKNKFGEPPVLASDVNLEHTTNILSNRLQNLGYFQAVATGDTVAKEKKVRAVYTVTPGVQYTIRKVLMPSDTLAAIELDISKRKRRSLLKPGDPYNLDVIKAERERIDGRLKENGYYFFNPDFLLMRVDSTVGNHQVDIFITLKPDAPAKALDKYYINKIFIYPNFTIGLDTLNADSNAIRYKDFYIIDPKNSYKPQVFDRALMFDKGDIYKRSDHNLTLNRLVSIGTFKFVKNRFVESPYSDSSLLDAYYYLTPFKSKSLHTELTGKTNTAGFAGTQLEVNWRHRNTFRGAELLTVRAYGGLDFQLTGQEETKGYNIYTLGSEVSITWPRFIPINFKSNGAFIPRTKFSIGYDWQNRQTLYTLNTFRSSFGYAWKGSTQEEHELNPLNITYVNSSNVTEKYMEEVALDPTLARVIEKQLIVGPTYSYTFTNTLRRNKKHQIYFNSKYDLSANLIGILQGANAKDSNYKSLAGVRYSQYVKTEQDLRYYLRLGKNNQWANRLYIGAGFPYGNSTELPFIKQFYSGGSNGLRGFRTRTLGPGTYRPVVTPGSFIPDQTGDIKLEIQSELRIKLFSIVHAGLFADAGNIWLKNENPLKPGAKFSNTFIKELAVDAGIGLRFDLSILFLRLDLAMPLRKPWLPDGKRWVMNEVDFGSSSWRKENLIFNLAVGMPF
jgi:outer membrane protein insertion porin family